MTATHVTPFEMFKSLVEFYPKLGASIAFETMAAAARMIPIVVLLLVMLPR
jgi:hypothetical protein